MVLRHSVGEYVAAFFSKACLFRQAFFVICAAQFGYGLGSPPFLVKPVFLDRLFFIYERLSSA